LRWFLKAFSANCFRQLQPGTMQSVNWSAVSQYRVVSLACDLQEPVRASVDAFFIN
jgi:hypothetical protein